MTPLLYLTRFIVHIDNDAVADFLLGISIQGKDFQVFWIHGFGHADADLCMGAFIAQFQARNDILIDLGTGIDTPAQVRIRNGDDNIIATFIDGKPGLHRAGDIQDSADKRYIGIIACHDTDFSDIGF